MSSRSSTGSSYVRLQAFIRLGRPKFLVYSALLYGLGALAAVYEGRTFELRAYLHGQILVWCVHLMTHYCNEYFDFAADVANTAPTPWTGGSRVLVERLLPPEVSLGAAFVLLFIAFALLLKLPVSGARWIALSMIGLAWFYTAPPLRFNYRGMGEIVVATVLNGLVPMLSFYLQDGQGFTSLLAALVPVIIAQHVRMVVMNYADYEGDHLVGKRTLAVILGRPRAALLIVGGQVAVYGAIAGFLAMGMVPGSVGWAMWMTLPLSIALSQRVLEARNGSPAALRHLPFMASTHVALLAATVMMGLIAGGAASGRIPLLERGAASLAGRLGMGLIAVYLVVTLRQVRSYLAASAS